MDRLRLEYVEAAAWADMLAAIPGPTRASLGATRRVSASGCARLVSAALSSPVLNRIIGLALAGPVTDAQVRAELAAFARAGVERYLVHAVPWAVAEGLGAQLVASGLERYHRSWAKFERGRSAVPAVSTQLTVRPAEVADASALGRAFATGFGLQVEAAPVFASVVGRDRWHAYVATDGDALAGVALLFIDQGVGYLAGATTLPAHRKRGAQAALMARRVRDALDLGCDLLGTETGEAVPGDPQHSFRNMERAGFRVAYLRENYAPAGLRF